jgi:hypothetical protein
LAEQSSSSLDRLRVLKRTADAGGPLDREVRRRITAKKRDVMARITDEEKASYTNWRWRLGISRRRMALAAFQHTVSQRRGVSATIRRGESVRIPRGFKTEGFTHAASGERVEGDRLLWRRAQKGDKSFGKGTPTTAGDVVRRLPVVFLRGPSIGQVVANAQDLLHEVHDSGEQRLEKEIHSQVQYELTKRWPR